LHSAFADPNWINTSDDQTWAVALAVSLPEREQADLTIVDIIPTEVVTAGIELPPGGPISADLKAVAVADHPQKLNALAEFYKQRLTTRVDVLVGRTYIEIIRAVLKNASELLRRWSRTQPRDS
jgi:universal stress protein E